MKLLEQPQKYLVQILLIKNPSIDNSLSKA